MKISNDLFTLEGKRALLTGATGYLGEFMARCLARAGAIVYINSRSEDRCQELTDRLRGEGLAAHNAVFDVTNDQEVGAFFERLSDPLHVLVNNAYAGGSGSIRYASPTDYGASYEVTVTAAHTLLVQALPALQRAVEESADASVINIGSMYGVVTPDPRLYESAKAMNPPFYICSSLHPSQDGLNVCMNFRCNQMNSLPKVSHAP